MLADEAVQYVSIRAHEDGRDLTTSFEAIKYTIELVQDVLPKAKKDAIRAKVQQKFEENRQQQIDAARRLLENNNYQVIEP